MIIEILGQKQAVEYAEHTEVRTSVISIASKGDADVVFPENPNIVSVLHLKFNDLTEEYDEEGMPYGRPLPQQQDLSGLKGFVTGLACDVLLVHCWEGRSRSAAVAEAVWEFRGRRDELHGRRDASPNPRVYMLARRELENETKEAKK